jgi:predicted Zn finger-like uncharacterized protein
MYTQCPNCETIFRISSEQLQVARGNVRCGDCNQPFNALDSLMDQPPEVSDESIQANTENQQLTDAEKTEELVTEDQPPYHPEDSLEFDVPEQNWSSFFVDAEPAPGIAPRFRNSGTEKETAEFISDTPEPSQIAENPADLGKAGVAKFNQAPIDTTIVFEIDESELPTGMQESQTSMDSDRPPWIRDRVNQTLPADSIQIDRGWSWTVICILAAALLTQLIHYNRDALAANASYGATTFAVYDRLDSVLYPEWPLEAYRVRGSEVVGGRRNALEIQARVDVVGRHAVGLPMIRITLRDRWSNPVAGKVFSPDEYLQMPGEFDGQLSPGTTIPVQIRVLDPGAEAQGYEMDICLPRRNIGLQCQNDRNPFQQ